MTDGPRPGGPPKPPDPRPPKTTVDRIAQLMATPLIQNAPALSPAQRDRLALIFGTSRRERARHAKAA